MDINDIIRLYNYKNYRLFDEVDHINIFGIRKYRGIVNKFDDKVGVLVKKEYGWRMRLWKATTDPGLYYLKNLLNKNGTAVLLEGQYKDCYRIDLHRGKYKAICQKEGMVIVKRDKNMNEKIDPISYLEKGYFGINIHRASKYKIVETIGRYSAGCQVIQDPSNFEELIKMAERSAGLYGNLFDYTLFNEVDLLRSIPIENIPVKGLEILDS